MTDRSEVDSGTVGVRAVLAAELVKVGRLWVLVPAIGVPLLLTVLGTLLVTLALPADGAAVVDDGAARLPGTVGGLGEANGATAGFRFVVVQVAQAMLCLFAVLVGAEYRHGTWKLLLVRQPFRGRLVAGKLLAGAIVSSVAVLVSMAVGVGITAAFAWAQGIGMSSWSVVAVLRTYACAVFAVVAAGVLGAALGLLVRSSTAAIVIGLSWFLVVETAVVAAPRLGEALSGWLPGQLVRAVTVGGDFVAGGTWGAAARLAGICVAALGVALLVFRTRNLGV